MNYDLPPDRIARYPLDERSDSRLMVLRRSQHSIEHMRFRDLPGLVRAGDLMVLNDTRVLPARLTGRKTTGANVEVLLLRPLKDRDPGAVWEALARPGRRLKPGSAVRVAPRLEVHVLEALPDGCRIVRLESDGMDPREALQRHGRVPLPPYLDRADEPLDRERYQTVYAAREGSVAAPTAGLHFTRELLDQVAGRGVAVRALTLHVGAATFRPVDVDDPAQHAMGAEDYDVPGQVADAHARCRAEGGRVWAVGTTVVRTLESAARGDGRVRAGSGSTDLFIRPPFRFRATDCLITNFHLPRSTLVMLVAALAGARFVRRAYAEAIERGYRFYSYGDAMAVLP